MPTVTTDVWDIVACDDHQGLEWPSPRRLEDAIGARDANPGLIGSDADRGLTLLPVPSREGHGRRIHEG
jgi:hypothetical protein